MKRSSILAAALFAGAATFQFADLASGEDGWITLLDSSNTGDWSEVGKANWEMKDGAMTADKLDGKDLSYLVSKNSYKDFQIKAEFWVDEEAKQRHLHPLRRPAKDRRQNSPSSDSQPTSQVPL